MLARLAQGYLRIGAAAVRLLGWLGLLAVLSALITLPVWWLAVSYPPVFSGLTLALFALGAGWFLVSRLRRSRRPVRVVALLALGLLAGAGVLSGTLWLAVVAALLATGMIALHVA